MIFSVIHCMGLLLLGIQLLQLLVHLNEILIGLVVIRPMSCTSTIMTGAGLLLGSTSVLALEIVIVWFS